MIPSAYTEKRNLTMKDLKYNYALIQKELGFGDCDLCYMSMYIEKDSSNIILQEMYVAFQFTPTARCKTEYMWSKFFAVETKLPMPVDLKVNKKWAEFNVFWSNHVSLSLRHFKQVVVITFANCRAITPMRGELCPKLKLLSHEVKIVKKYHPRAQELIWIPNKEDINGSEFVCTHKYILYQNSASSLKHHSCPLMILTIIIFGPICYMRFLKKKIVDLYL